MIYFFELKHDQRCRITGAELAHRYVSVEGYNHGDCQQRMVDGPWGDQWSYQCRSVEEAAAFGPVTEHARIKVDGTVVLAELEQLRLEVKAAAEWPVWAGPMDDEREILNSILIDAIEWGWKHVTSCAPSDPQESAQLARTAVVGVVRRLRTMSARQLAVVLAAEPNTGSGWVIHEPPAYTDEQKSVIE